MQIAVAQGLEELAVSCVDSATRKLSKAEIATRVANSHRITVDGRRDSSYLSRLHTAVAAATSAALEVVVGLDTSIIRNTLVSLLCPLLQ